MVLLSGCATTKTLTVTVKEYPPEYLTQDCPAPASIAKKNGELVKDIAALRGAIRTCNVDKAALREWAKKE
jgi:hypothetical protein